MSKNHRVLVLDGMWNKSLATVRSLGKHGFFVTAGERTRLAPTLFSRYCCRRIVYPSALKKPEAFLDTIEKELATGSYIAVLPMEWSTQELLTRSANRGRIEQYACLPFVDSELAERVNDKAWQMAYAENAGIDIPHTVCPRNLAELLDISSNFSYPAVIKPRNSSGSRGLLYAATRDELIYRYKQVHEFYPFPIIQEYIPNGGAYGVGTLLNFESEPRATFVYRRLREFPVSGGPSTVRESVEHCDLKTITEKLFKGLGWYGVAHAEFRTDPRDGKPKLIEINPRFWGSLSLAINAGMDFPYMLCKMALDGDVSRVSEYKTGIVNRNIIPGDILHFINNPNRFNMNPAFFNISIKDDIICSHDYLPIIGRILSAFTLISDSEMRRLIK